MLAHSRRCENGPVLACSPIVGYNLPMQIRELIAALEAIAKEYGDNLNVQLAGESGEPKLDDITTYETETILYL